MAGSAGIAAMTEAEKLEQRLSHLPTFVRPRAYAGARRGSRHGPEVAIVSLDSLFAVRSPPPDGPAACDVPLDRLEPVVVAPAEHEAVQPRDGDRTPDHRAMSSLARRPR